jgi:hypothetical protein
MDMHPGPQSDDLALRLPRDVYYQLIHMLHGALPASRTPEDEIRRDNAAMAQVACMLPANADEANLAAHCVAAQASAMEALRRANTADADLATTMKFTNLAATMMRHASGAQRLLMRLQAQRQKREADSVATDRAAWVEHCAIGLMADALGRPAPAPVAEPPPLRLVADPEPAEDAEPAFDQASEADQYAIIHPRRAALIRSLRGLPAKLDFGPPAPELVHAIVTGTSPTLRALDAGG